MTLKQTLFKKGIGITSPPISPIAVSTQKDRRTSYLRILSYGWLAMGVLAFVSLFFFPDNRTQLLTVIGVTASTFIVIFVLLHFERVSLAGVIFCTVVSLSFFAFFTIDVLELGAEVAFQTRLTVAMMSGIGIIFAGSLISRWAALSFAALSSIIMIGMAAGFAVDSGAGVSIHVFWWLLALAAWMFESTFEAVYKELDQTQTNLEATVTARTSELSKANEELKHLSEVKDEFVANVSHELRTPITNLRLYQQLIRQNPDHTERYLGVLERETRRLDSIIETLLRLSRMDQTQTAINPVRLNLNQIAAQLVSDREAAAASKRISLVFDPGPGHLYEVMADAELLTQAVSVLLTNAVNYTPSGGQIITRTINRSDDSFRWAGIAISDTGPGITDEDMSRLFERFFRGKAGRESGEPGTGLGLALVKQIVDMHGGQVEVQSESIPGKGSTFTIWLERT